VGPVDRPGGSGRPVTPADDVWRASPVVDSAALAVLGFDLDRRVRLCNPAAARLLGRPAREVVGRDVAELFPPDRATATLARIEAAVRGDLGHLEVVLRGPDGATLDAGISFAPLVAEGITHGVVGVGRDIRRRKQLEHQLAELASSYQALSENSDLGMYRCRVDRDGTVHFDHANRALLAAAGLSLQELRADAGSLLRRLPGHLAARLRVAWEQGVADPDPVELDWRLPTGETVTLSVLQVPVRGDDGRLEALLGLVRDVTRQRREEASLAEALTMEREAARRLRRVDDLRRLFLQAVSHELRTPLTAVLGFSTTLRRHAPRLDPAQVVDVSDRIVGQATKMERLLDDLLDVERLSRGVIILERRPVDVGELVEAVAVEHGDHDVEVAAEPAPAEVDPGKLERIVVNLLTNARRHGGPEARIRLTVAPDAEVVRVQVDDDGPGLPPELRDEVFEAFAQGPRSADQAAPGTGIGLALVAEFARLHGGRAFAEDSDLGGARFVVELPRGGDHEAL
jgi:PAS domain S-box-containing protein